MRERCKVLWKESQMCLKSLQSKCFLLTYEGDFNSMSLESGQMQRLRATGLVNLPIFGDIHLILILYFPNCFPEQYQKCSRGQVKWRSTPQFKEAGNVSPQHMCLASQFLFRVSEEYMQCQQKSNKRPVLKHGSRSPYIYASTSTLCRCAQWR